jgi:hypothetical protein
VHASAGFAQLTSDPNLIEQTKAAWSAAHAAWFAGSVGVVAASATLAAVYAAFRIQMLQQRGEDELRKRARRDLWLSAIDSCRRASGQIKIVGFQSSQADFGPVQCLAWARMLDFGLDLVAHFLSRDLNNTDILAGLLNARWMLQDARLVVNIEPATVGFVATGQKFDLSRVANMRAEIVRCEAGVDALLEELNRVAANLD